MPSQQTAEQIPLSLKFRARNVGRTRAVYHFRTGKQFANLYPVDSDEFDGYQAFVDSVARMRERAERFAAASSAPISH